jgi:hypothetical protein
LSGQSPDWDSMRSVQRTEESMCSR